MQYTEVHIDYSQAAPYVQDLVEQALADIGYESFLDSIAYVQSTVYNEELLHNVLSDYPEVQLIRVALCEDKNWNETWEQESYAPALLERYDICIVPHNAFGSGTHPTTCMMLDAIGQYFAERNEEKEGSHKAVEVLDMGCGTGVLGIYCAKNGAIVTAVDIDEWSVRNAEENAALNGVQLHTLLRDANMPELGCYDLILANIHRNILIADLPLYAAHLRKGGRLFFSGFYESDIPMLREAIKQEGLQINQINGHDEWRMIEIR